MSIDCGIYGVKAVGGKGEILFESIIYPKPDSMIKFTGDFGLANPFEVVFDDIPYVLGDHAKFLQTLNPISFTTHGAGGSKNSEDSVIKALGAVCRYLDTYEDFEDDEIEVYAFFGSPLINATDEEEVAAIQARFENKGRPFDYNYNGFDLKIRFNHLEVMPEGAAAFYSSVPFKSLHTYIADAGSQTINLIAFMNGMPNGMAANTLKNGVEYFKRNYSAHTAKMLAKAILSEAERLKWDPAYTVWACGGYALELASAFNDLQDNPYTMELVRPELVLEGKKGLKKTLDPVFANAVGMYVLAKAHFNEEIVG